MDCSNIPITTLIPQRPPFVMVDRLVSCDEVDAQAEFLVRPDNILVDGEELSHTGIMENLAQSCAARMGCLSMIHNEPVRVGFIGDIRNCKLLRRPKVGEKISTTVHVAEDVFNLTLAEMTARVGDEVIASATMKIALVDKEERESSNTETDKRHD